MLLQSSASQRAAVLAAVVAVVVVAAVAVVAAVVVLLVSGLKSDSRSNPPFAPKSFPSLMTLSRNVSAHSSCVVLKMLRNESNMDWQKHQDSGVETE